MEKTKVLIYGANGYTGQLLTKTISKDEFDVVLAGRTSFDSSDWPTRIFGLNDETVVIEHLKDVKLVVNVAGPFTYTNTLLVEACIKSGTHYTDVAGETPEMEAVYAYDDRAKQANVMLMPGAGFAVVPTDIAANLVKSLVPDAANLTIAFVANGSASRGTFKTIMKDINKPGVRLVDGTYQKAMPAESTFTLNVNDQKHELVYNPWRADLFTAKISTGIPNIESYSKFPDFIVKMMQGKTLWLRDIMVNYLVYVLPLGPSEKERENGSTICHAVASSSTCRGTVTIIGPEAYVFTVYALIAIARKVLANDVKFGFQTPSIYGQSLLDGIPKVDVTLSMVA